MIMRLKKWKCTKCEQEYFGVFGAAYFICEDCGGICNPIYNEWKINEGAGDTTKE